MLFKKLLICLIIILCSVSAVSATQFDNSLIKGDSFMDKFNMHTTNVDGGNIIYFLSPGTIGFVGGLVNFVKTVPTGSIGKIDYLSEVLNVKKLEYENLSNLSNDSPSNNSEGTTEGTNWVKIINSCDNVVNVTYINKNSNTVSETLYSHKIIGIEAKVNTTINSSNDQCFYVGDKSKNILIFNIIPLEEVQVNNKNYKATISYINAKNKIETFNLNLNESKTIKARRDTIINASNSIGDVYSYHVGYERNKEFLIPAYKENYVTITYLSYCENYYVDQFMYINPIYEDEEDNKDFYKNFNEYTDKNYEQEIVEGIKYMKSDGMNTADARRDFHVRNVGRIKHSPMIGVNLRMKSYSLQFAPNIPVSDNVQVMKIDFIKHCYYFVMDEYGTTKNYGFNFRLDGLDGYVLGHYRSK
ncbi:MAG: hypothetical protein LBB45_09550 [Methanobrevibacter sp.]|jgi:hypothetical protein|nr:hypothetical protein [Candidatus Methanovirga basalitermitum]